jgi:predicted transcriptional regulator
MEFERLPESELDIMKVLWAEKRALKASEVVKLLADKYSWKVPTAHVLLSRLLNKGFVDVDKNGYSHKFFPLIDEKEYFAGESVLLMKKANGRLPMMFASLVESEDVSEEELLELSEMLDRRLREIKKKNR